MCTVTVRVSAFVVLFLLPNLLFAYLCAARINNRLHSTAILIIRFKRMKRRKKSTVCAKNSIKYDNYDIHRMPGEQQ